MARFFRKRDKNRGMPPGSLIFIGSRKVEEIIVTIFNYDNEKVTIFPLDDIREAAPYRTSPEITWINVDGIHDPDVIKNLGETFDLHPLLLEDILNTGQRPKLDDFDSCLTIITKMLQWDEGSRKIISEQVSIILGDTWVITLQEQPGDVFDTVRERINKAKGRVRNCGADYLAYALLDTIVDNYIYIVERIGEKVEDLEVLILNNGGGHIPTAINALKQEIHFLRKSIRPVQEAILKLTKLETPLIEETTRPFLKDLQDHITHACEAVDTYSDLLSDHFNTYNSLINNRMNDIMRVLTVIATIFIPITFLAGIYGMNFDYMPELRWKFAYFIVWGLFLLVIGGMLSYFKKKKWL
ncbi:magnesium/cobalt transporter CorA [bacterium]|nr:magnesium/cobalt transporter CorA [bacterium]